jgi:hypothetical protein
MSFSRLWTQVGAKSFNYKEDRPFEPHISDLGDDLEDTVTMGDHNLGEATNQDQTKELKDDDDAGFDKLVIEDRKLHLGDHSVDNLKLLQNSIVASHNLKNRLSLSIVQKQNPFHSGGVNQIV